jgi:hypothetical protein
MPKKTTQYKKIGARSSRAKPRFGQMPPSVSELLSKRPLFKALAAGLAPQAQWGAWLQSVLPAELGVHVVNVIPKRDHLIVYADSAAWSTRLRYELAAIEGQIGARDAKILRAVVRVMPK